MLTRRCWLVAAVATDDGRLLADAEPVALAPVLLLEVPTPPAVVVGSFGDVGLTALSFILAC